MFRKITCAAIATAALFLAASCSKPAPIGEHPTVAPADPLWSGLISAHSTGAISRHSSLQVIFANDIVAADRVGTDASAWLAVEPPINAKVTFASRREIVAEPQDGELAPGTTYKVRLRGKGLTGIDPQ